MFVAEGTGTVGLLIYAKSPTHSTITSGRPPVCTGGVVGLPLLSTPSALADPALTASEAKYVAMLAQGPSGYGGIRAAPGRTDYDLAQGGHLIANDLRQGVGLEQEVLNVYGSGDSLWLIQAPMDGLLGGSAVRSRISARHQGQIQCMAILIANERFSPTGT